jgi:hypothetical protein
MPKELLVFGEKTFKITIPDDSRITFGPWSPPSATKNTAWDAADRRGTLRIYEGKSKTSENIIAVFTGVTGFRDTTLDYSEQVLRLEGEAVWKSDERGYEQRTKGKTKRAWLDDTHLLRSGDDEEEDDDGRFDE